jgi:hypothetical protein
LKILEFEFDNPGQFEETMAPIVGDVTACAPKGTAFDVRVRTCGLDKLSLFTVKSSTIQVDIPPSGFYSLNVPLGSGFSVVEEGDRVEVDRTQAHVMRGDAPFVLSARDDVRALVIYAQEADVIEAAARLIGGYLADGEP